MAGYSNARLPYGGKGKDGGRTLGKGLETIERPRGAGRGDDVEHGTPTFWDLSTKKDGTTLPSRR